MEMSRLQCKGHENRFPFSPTEVLESGVGVNMMGGIIKEELYAIIQVPNQYLNFILEMLFLLYISGTKLAVHLCRTLLKYFDL